VILPVVIPSWMRMLPAILVGSLAGLWPADDICRIALMKRMYQHPTGDAD
jgi:hypothetical protein